MSKNLVIVESPAKAKTIEKFLGGDFKVVSSYGHISDLPSKELGVDVEGDFTPHYSVSSDKKKVVKELKILAKKAETVWLASDEDREGEAIAWHLAEQLDLNQQNTKRIVFNEITKSAIQRAIKTPRSIDYNLVNAQQARRVLDRLVGYEISPILWRKVKGGLSAGRVQSVAVRLIVEREREIHVFVAESNFKVQGIFKTNQNKTIKADLSKTFSSADLAKAFLTQNTLASFHVHQLEKKPAVKQPSAPFTTSTLQQEASRKLGFSVGRTMSTAQRLYESGLITYMRTDSVNLSKDATSAIKQVISDTYGPDYAQQRQYKSKNKGAQEAHEAVRPTEVNRSSIDGPRDQERLYDLIWKRTVASQMSDAKLERTIARIGASTHKELFIARGEIITFEGFLKVYLEGVDDVEENESGILPPLKEGEVLTRSKITATERFSRPPYRYSEASLVKKLEELGIGRPSTYAPTISTIQNRKYIEKGTIDGVERSYQQFILKTNDVEAILLTEKVGSDKGKLVPTDVGMLVNDFLTTNFENIVDYNFTANVERDFDKIATGNEEWKSLMKNFYKDFHPIVEYVKDNAQREIGERILGVDPKTGRQLSVRLGRFGPMAQIGTAEEDEKPLFASLSPDQQLSSITLEQALELFKLPAQLGTYEELEVETNNGRYGPYIKHGTVFISLPTGKNPLEVTLEDAIKYIEEKKKIDAPIDRYEGYDVTKGKGRFGPFIKWNGMFINVNKSYDFDHLTHQDIVKLIEDKKKKEIEKLIHHWENEGIRVEKARWGRHTILQGKTKIELPKEIDVKKLTLKDVQEIIEKNKPVKKKRAKKKK